MENRVQGYVGTITNRGKRSLLAFSGGVCQDVLGARIFRDPGEAIDTARSVGKSIYDLPGALGVDEYGGLVELNG